MYYVEKENKIVLFNESLEKLQATLNLTPQYKGLEIKETTRPIADFEFADTEEYAQEQAQKEAERISMLNLTAADVERAVYKAKGIDFEDVVALVEQYNQTQNTPIDIKALKIELKANSFYRGNPYIDAVGTLLGFTKEQLDEFFETNDYTKLLPPGEPADTDDDSDTDSDVDTDTDLDGDSDSDSDTDIE